MDEVAERIYKLGEASGRAEGREEGRAEGRTEEKRDTAKRLRRDGTDVHKIASFVDASIEDVCEWLDPAPVTA